MVMNVIWGRICVSVICSGLGKSATSEVRKYLFRVANVRWRCAKYFVIAFPGRMPRDNRCVYMAHVCFLCLL